MAEQKKQWVKWAPDWDAPSGNTCSECGSPTTFMGEGYETCTEGVVPDKNGPVDQWGEYQWHYGCPNRGWPVSWAQDKYIEDDCPKCIGRDVIEQDLVDQDPSEGCDFCDESGKKWRMPLEGETPLGRRAAVEEMPVGGEPEEDEDIYTRENPLLKEFNNHIAVKKINPGHAKTVRDYHKSGEIPAHPFSNLRETEATGNASCRHCGDPISAGTKTLTYSYAPFDDKPFITTQHVLHLREEDCGATGVGSMMRTIRDTVGPTTTQVNEKDIKCPKCKDLFPESEWPNHYKNHPAEKPEKAARYEERLVKSAALKIGAEGYKVAVRDDECPWCWGELGPGDSECSKCGKPVSNLEKSAVSVGPDGKIIDNRRALSPNRGAQCESCKSYAMVGDSCQACGVSKAAGIKDVMKKVLDVPGEAEWEGTGHPTFETIWHGKEKGFSDCDNCGGKADVHCGTCRGCPGGHTEYCANSVPTDWKTPLEGLKESAVTPNHEHETPKFGETLGDMYKHLRDKHGAYPAGLIPEGNVYNQLEMERMHREDHRARPFGTTAFVKGAPYGISKEVGGDTPAHTKKMEDCVDQVMAKGKSKESAIKICKSSLQDYWKKREQHKSHTKRTAHCGFCDIEKNYKERAVTSEIPEEEDGSKKTARERNGIKPTFANTKWASLTVIPDDNIKAWGNVKQ